MTTTTKSKPQLTVGRAYDALAALHSARHSDCDDAVRKVHERYAKKESAIFERLPEGDAEKVRSLLFDGDTPDIGGFGTDPRDSAALCDLRVAIDEHLGWLDQEQEDEADYVARVIGVGVELKKLKSATVTDSEFRDPAVDGDDEAAPEPDPDPLPRGTTDYVPGAAARAALGRR